MYLNRPDYAVAPPAPPPPPTRAGVAGWLVRRVLRFLHKGRLTVILPSGARIEHRGREPGPDAVFEVHKVRALRRLVTRGDLGFAEGYIAGDWSTPDLVALLTVCAANVERLQATIDGFAVTRLVKRARHLVRGNSRRGSRRNIAFHYDLGNDFYRLWLDQGMTYSSAIAIRPGETLEQAQAAKLERIAELLDLTGRESVLEIGSGWGTLAAHIASRCAQVTGITLSREQAAYAEALAATLPTDNVVHRIQDYRDVDQRFDRIVSIEMIEAVGEAYWPVYFEKLRAALKPGGRVVLQVIMMREDLLEPYRRRSDFIQRYIFPGGMLLSPRVVAEQTERVGFKIRSVETFGQGYADTLAEWRRRFVAASREVERLGFDEDFRKLWEYYLSYCEAGFRIGTIDVGLYVLDE